MNELAIALIPGILVFVGFSILASGFLISNAIEKLNTEDDGNE